MPQEIELKFLEINKAETEAQLKSLGAIRESEYELMAAFYDYPDNRLTNEGAVLRIRKEGPEIKLTHKAHISREGAKIMEETELSVDDFESMETILFQLGLQLVKKTRKIRISYKLEKVHIVLDNYLDELDHIPLFLEIEADHLDALNHTIAKLGLNVKDGKSWSTYELVEYYKLL